jgi:hypothetical protein
MILLLTADKAKDKYRFHVLTKVAYFSKVKVNNPAFSGDGGCTPVYMVTVLGIVMVGN